MRTDEEYRHECEAKRLAALPNWRVTDELRAVEKARGLVEAQRLAATIRELRKKGRANIETPVYR